MWDEDKKSPISKFASYHLTSSLTTSDFLTSKFISEVVTGCTCRIRIQELHLELHRLVIGRGSRGITGVLVSVEDEPEVGADPLVDHLFSIE